MWDRDPMGEAGPVSSAFWLAQTITDIEFSTGAPAERLIWLSIGIGSIAVLGALLLWVRSRDSRLAIFSLVLLMIVAGQGALTYEVARLQTDIDAVYIQTLIGGSLGISFLGIVTIYVISWFINERIRTLSLLHESEKRFADMVEQQSEFIVRWLPDGSIIYANPAYCRYRETTFDDQVHAHFINSFPAHERATLAESVNTLGPHKPLMHVVRQQVCPDGKLRWINWTDRAVFNKRGQTVEYMSVGRDVTAQILAERKLRESDARFRSLSDTSTVGIWQFSVDQHALYINMAMCRMLQIDSPALMLGRTTGEFFRKDQWEIIERNLRTHDVSASNSFEVELIGQQGVPRTCLVCCTRLRGEDDEIDSYIGTFTDITDRKESEELIRDNVERYRTLIAATASVVWTTNSEGRFVTPQLSWEAYTGQTWAQHANFGWLGAVHPDNRPSVEHQWKQAVRDGLQFRQETQLWDAATEGYRYVVIRAAPVLDVDGSVREWIGTVTDVHDRRAAETALRRHALELNEWKNRYDAAVEATGQVLYDWDPKTSEVLLGGSVEQMLGYNSDQIEPTLDWWTGLVHESDRERFVAEVRRVRQTGDPFSLEYRIRRSDDRYLLVENHGCFFKLGPAGGERMIGFVLDVTQRRAAERALRDSEYRFRLLADAAPVLIWITDADGKCVYFNKPWLDFRGRSIKQECSDGWEGAVHADDRRSVLSKYHDAVRARRPFSVEHQLLRHDGDYRWMLVNAVPMFLTDGAFAGYISTCVDISDRRRSEERQRLMMAELDHRVKNNLAAVMSLADQTARNAPDLESFRQTFLGRLGAMAHTHEALAHNRWEGIRLDEAARLTLSAFEQDNPERLAILGEPVTLPARAALPISLALHELATNAAKYGALSKPNGHVDLNWSRNNGTVEISWKESGGPAIHDLSPTPGIGTGLISGLVCYELGGEVEMEYQPTGLICHMRLPLDDADA